MDRHNTRENLFTNDPTRIIYISDKINHSDIGLLCFNIAYYNQVDDEAEQNQKNYIRKPIKLFINSTGGSTYDMWAAIDAILTSKTPIYTYCTGYAMSSAFKIYLAGHKRFATRHATFMYHQVILNQWGTYESIKEEQIENDWAQNKIEEYILSKTKLTKKILNDVRKSKKNLFIHEDEFIKFGIVDEIIKEVDYELEG